MVNILQSSTKIDCDEYRLTLSLDNYNKIQDISYNRYNLSGLAEDIILQIDINSQFVGKYLEDKLFQNFSYSKRNDLILFLLFQDCVNDFKINIKDIHCRCMGISKENFIASIQTANSFKEIQDDTNIACACTKCLDNSLALWGKYSKNSPNFKTTLENNLSSSQLTMKIEKFLGQCLSNKKSYKVFELMYPYLYLKSNIGLQSCYKKEVQEIEREINSYFNDNFIVTILF